jgi:hypothetical protein
VQLDSQTFKVQQDFNYVFLYTFDGAVLVEHTVNLGRSGAAQTAVVAYSAMSA